MNIAKFTKDFGHQSKLMPLASSRRGRLATRRDAMTRLMTLLAAALVASAMAGEAGAWGGPCYKSPGEPHPNGGGWVGKWATVDDTVYVSPDAYVCTATVSDNARLIGHAYVNQGRVYDNAIIRSYTYIHGGSVYGNAEIASTNILSGARVYGNAKATSGTISGEVFGTAHIAGAHITLTGKVDCGRWENIRVTTDRTGECGLNGNQPRQPRVNDLFGTLDPGNTQSPDIQQWGDGALLSNPLDPGATGLGE